MATVLIVALGSALAVLALQRMENPRYEFETYADMQASGLIQAGWIPRFLPESSFDIAHTHNLDSNAVDVSFRYAPGDSGRAEQHCGTARIEPKQLIFSCSAGVLKLSADGHGRYRSGAD